MSAGESSGSVGTPDTLAVEIVVWSLDQPPYPPEMLEAWLSPDELARANRFKFPHLRRRWIAARAGMRSLLAGRLGVSPSSLAFNTGAHGKPYLAGAGLHPAFNLSHSDSLAALALADVELGVDIERIAEAHDSVARDQFSSAEYNALSRLTPDARIPAFYAMWTAKEAVLKALGTGFSLASNSFTVDILGPGKPTIAHAEWPYPDYQDWQIARFDPAPHFAGAIAARTPLPIRINLSFWN